MIDEGARVVVPGTVASVAAAREFVRASLDGGDGALAGRVDDIVLVVSELVTNAIEYGAGHDVEIELSVTAERVELAVTAPSDGLPRVADATPPADSLRGRGLFIAASLSDGVEFDRVDDSNRVTCVFVAG